ncbi:MAG TPA: glycosyltransferase family 4 protein [Candidatus Woesebacteria bacterium]|nr:glycosyltransferase family 4 protein [Candidatus Woesebacteria bacterium]
MKKNTVALYDPYLDVLGGGEKHILSIMKVLADEGYDATIFWNKDLSEEIKSHLNISFPKLTFQKNIFLDTSESVFSRLDKLKQYDTLLYVTDGSYFFSTAKKTVIFCMVPQRSLYNMTALNKLKTVNSTFISNSIYTQQLLSSWHVKSKVVYPFISEEFFQNYSEKKQKKILVVGRFFTQLHAKRQDLAIEWFIELQKKNLFTDYKLQLVGNIKNEDNRYYEKLQKLAKGNKNIEFYPNVSFKELLQLYKHAEIYWHMTGIGINEQKNPEKVEHLGITPLEAMASGCVVFAYNAGGLKELIIDGKNGYLFSNQEDLFTKMQHLSHTNVIQKNAYNFVEHKFDYAVFAKRVKEILL